MLLWAHSHTRLILQLLYINITDFKGERVSKEKFDFRRLLIKNGCSQKSADAIWKWYNPF
jgi:hypothetical protein